MKKIVLAVVLALALVVGAVGIAGAITNGTPDNYDHPYVALLVLGVDSEDGFVPFWRCSGSLIAPNVILTAGHCTEGTTRAVAWFEPGPVLWGTMPDTASACDSYTGYPCTGDAAGDTYLNPDYRSDENPYGGGNGLPAFSYRDVGIIVLDEPIDVGGLAQLPEAGLVDTLPNKAPVDFVGYGVQYQVQIPGKFLPQPPPYYRWAGPRERLYAPSNLVSGNFVFSPEFARLALNPGGGTGGTCFGDSGGPDLLGGTDTVLSVNSFVTNINCSGVGYSSRIDIPEVLEWIYTFMP